MKKSIISTLFVCVVVLMTVACGSTPAKNDDAVVEKSVDNSREEVNNESSEILLNDDQSVMKIADLMNNIENKIRSKDESSFKVGETWYIIPIIDEQNIDEQKVREIKALVKKLANEVKSMPSVVEINGQNITKDFLVFFVVDNWELLEVLEKRARIQRKIDAWIEEMKKYGQNYKIENIKEHVAIFFNESIVRKLWDNSKFDSKSEFGEC